MSMNNLSLPEETTLEKLIEGLDQRGLLIFQILLGKQAMSLLEKEKTKEVLPKNIIV